MIIQLTVHEDCQLSSYDITPIGVSKLPTGKIYLDAGKNYDCSMISERHVLFGYALNDVALSFIDLDRLVNNRKITIKRDKIDGNLKEDQ